MSPTYRATFTSDPRSVTLARNAIGRFARMCAFPDSEIADIRLAAGEALTNAAQWGSGKRGGGFSVHCTFEQGEMRIEIQDSGTGFSSEEPSGFGTVIMRSLVDAVEYSRGGTRVRLVKKIADPLRR